MLLHQFILALVPAVKRFEAKWLHLRGVIRQVISRVRLGGSDLQQT